MQTFTDTPATVNLTPKEKARLKWKLLDRASKDRVLSAGAVKLLLRLVIRADSKTDTCFPGHKRLAKELHCDEIYLSVRVRGNRKSKRESWFQQLEAGGYIAITKRKGHRGFDYRVIYAAKQNSAHAKS
jgi:hypothetical protein